MRAIGAGVTPPFWRVLADCDRRLRRYEIFGKLENHVRFSRCDTVV
jgi:hypothetical protein